jgi:hypothetical protein
MCQFIRSFKYLARIAKSASGFRMLSMNPSRFHAAQDMAMQWLHPRQFPALFFLTVHRQGHDGSRGGSKASVSSIADHANCNVPPSQSGDRSLFFSLFAHHALCVLFLSFHVAAQMLMKMPNC